MKKYEKPQNGTNMALIKRIMRYFTPHWWRILLALACTGLVSASTAGSAFLVKPALDDIFINKNEVALLYVPLLFILVTFTKGIGRYFQNYFMNYSAMNVLATLRMELFQKIVYLPIRFFENSQVGSLMSHILNDVAMIQRSLPAGITIFRQITTMAGLVGVVFYQNAELAVWAVVVLPLALIPFAYFGKALRRYGRRSAEINAGVSSMLLEVFSGIRVIKAFATEKYEMSRFSVENAQIVKVFLKQVNTSEFSSPVMELVGAFGIAGIIWYGGTEVMTGNMTPGSFFSFVAALVMLYDPVKALSSANMEVQGALAGAERVFGILDDPTMNIEESGERDFSDDFQELSFQNVSFEYGNTDRPALNSVSFTIKAGERVAVVGPSGAGKTTFVNLIPRFYEPQQGSILLNKIPLSEYKLASLRRSIAIVSQDAFLFDTSIRDNIAYGQSDVQDSDIIAAAHAAYADAFISELPEAYATRVGERGVKLSGGQKQRLTIARALLKNAPLLILDEATSALDSESESIVQKALDNLMKNRTSIVIAHRLATILHADKILVMDGGMLLDCGTHEELLERCALYNKLYSLQFMQSQLAGAASSKEVLA